MHYGRFVLSNPRFLAFGFLLTFCSSLGQTYFISQFATPIRAAFGLGDDAGAAVYGRCYSLATLCSGLSLIWLGSKVDTVDLRVFTLLLCVAIACACVAMSLVPSLALLCVVFFMLRLTGQGLLSHTSMTSMARYFHEERGRAMSVAGLGFPAAEATMPLIAVGLMGVVGWRMTWQVFALAMLLMMTPLIMWLLRGHGVRHTEHLELVDRMEREAAASETPGARQWRRSEVLRDWRFYCVIPAATAPAVLVTGVFFYGQDIASSKGWSAEWWAGCFTVFAITQVLSGLATGLLVDRAGAMRLLPLFTLPLTLGLMTLGSSDDRLAGPAFFALTGVTGGMASTIIGSVWAEVYGVKHVGSIRAMVTAIMVFGTAAAPVTLGELIARGVGMDALAWMMAAYAGGTALLTLPAVRAGGSHGVR